MGASGKEEGGGRGRRDAAAGGYPPEQEEGRGAAPMVSREGGRRGVAARVGAGVGSGAATLQPGLGVEHARGLGKSLFHPRSINPANKHAARAHQSLDC